MSETIVNAIISGIFSLIGIWLKNQLDKGSGSCVNTIILFILIFLVAFFSIKKSSYLKKIIPQSDIEKFILPLKNGDKKVYYLCKVPDECERNTPNSIKIDRYFDDIDFFHISKCFGNCEYSEYCLVNAKNGEEYEILGNPVFSPTKQRFACQYSYGGYSSPISFEIWNFNNGRPFKEFEDSDELCGNDGARIYWINDNAIKFETTYYKDNISWICKKDNGRWEHISKPNSR